MFFPEENNPPNGNGSAAHGAATPKYLTSSPSLRPSLDPAIGAPPPGSELPEDHLGNRSTGAGFHAAATAAVSAMNNNQQDAASVYNLDPADELRQLTSPVRGPAGDDHGDGGGGGGAVGGSSAISSAINVSTPRLQLEGHDLPASLPTEQSHGIRSPFMLEDNTPFPDNARLSESSLPQVTGGRSSGSIANMLGLAQLAGFSDADQNRGESDRDKVPLGQEVSIEVGMGSTFLTNLLGYSPRTGDQYTFEDKKQPIPSDSSAFKKRFVFYSNESGPVQAESFLSLKYSPQSGDTHCMAVEDLLRLPTFWLDITDPTDSEMKLLSSIFHIHPLTTEDIQTDSTREKFELYKSYYFICYSAIDGDPSSAHYMEPQNIYILVYPKFILTFHDRPLSTLSSLLKRIQQLKSYVTVSPHWIAYVLLDDMTDRYEPLVYATQDEVDTIDDLVLILSEAEQGDMLRRIANVRKRVMTLQRLMVSKAEVLRVLLKRLESLSYMRDGSLAKEVKSIRDTTLYIGDVQDHVITMVQMLSDTNTTLSRAHSNYLASITVEITQSANRTNAGMTQLTVLASVLVPLNVVTGLWGMNVKVPGQDADGNAWFFGILGGMVALMVALFVAARYSGLMK